MNIFSTILQKLGLSKPAAPAATAAPVKPVAPATPATPVKSATPAATTSTPVPVKPAVPAAPAKPAAISEVDVVKKLEQMASGSGLNWKVSIVDLLKILGIDSSREARNELAKELGCPTDLMSDSAKMNVWLHKEVLRKIAENGGNIPQDLLN